MEGWHFLQESKTDEDNRPAAGRDEGAPELYYASKRAIDALGYASGPIVCRVDVGETIVEEDDAFAGTGRKVLWMADATQVLHEFACWCAEWTLLREREVGREPDPRSWKAIKVKRAWLKGEATDAELVAVERDAWAATAALLTVFDDAADAAEHAAAYAAAYAAENKVQNAELEEMLEGLK